MSFRDSNFKIVFYEETIYTLKFLFYYQFFKTYVNICFASIFIEFHKTSVNDWFLNKLWFKLVILNTFIINWYVTGI